MTPRRVLLACEVTFVVLALVGVALVNVPAALMLGGLAGVLACERALVDKRAAGARHGGDAAGGGRQ
ncbi:MULTISPECIES: hypothetical protein [Actinomycetes]|uniref:hypothetical protein n=1 Tax=Actinomycetes TaxID=1760 RepID=UPI003408A6F5